MIKFNEESAIKEALVIAKAVCENPSTHIVPNKQSAEDIAEFIRTLEANFLSDN